MQTWETYFKSPAPIQKAGMVSARAGRAETGGSLDLLATSGVPVSLGDLVSKERHGGIVQDTWVVPLALHAYTYMNAHTCAHILHSHNTTNKLNINKFKMNSHISFPARNNLLSSVILTFPGNTTQDRFSECLLGTSLSWYLLFYLSYLDIYLYFTMRKLKWRDQMTYSKSHNGQIGETRLLRSPSALFVPSS